MKVGIIGFGNMGSAFAKGFSLALGKENVLVYDKDPAKREVAVSDGFAFAGDPYFLIKESDVILLAVKPKDLKDLLGSIKDQIDSRIVVSVAAGVPLKFYEDILGSGKKIVRLMPNLAVKVGKGTVAYADNGNLTEEEALSLKDLLSRCGEVFEIPEDLFDSFTALAGSGPAFVFSFIDALAMAGVRGGFSYETALKIVVSTLMGSGELLRSEGGNPNDWITKVTSPAGTTVEGIAYLEKKGFRGIVMGCVEKTIKRARDLKG